MSNTHQPVGVCTWSHIPNTVMERRSGRFSVCCPFRYYETISEVLSSVRKMEESLKRLKQARKGASTAAAATAAANGGPTDDGKIRLQLALDVEYLGEQV